MYTERKKKVWTVACWSRLCINKSWTFYSFFGLSRLESTVMILICRKHFNRSGWLGEMKFSNGESNRKSDSADWQLTNQTCCSRSTRKQAPRIFLPTITRDKNSFAFQSREPAFGPREKNLRIREHSLPSNSTPLRYFLLFYYYHKFKFKKNRIHVKIILRYAQFFSHPKEKNLTTNVYQIDYKIRL